MTIEKVGGIALLGLWVTGPVAFVYGVLAGPGLGGGMCFLAAAVSFGSIGAIVFARR
jgi:hypothetical protein